MSESDYAQYLPVRYLDTSESAVATYLVLSSVGCQIMEELTVGLTSHYFIVLRQLKVPQYT